MPRGADYEELPDDLGLVGRPPPLSPPIRPRVATPPYDTIPHEWFELLCVDVAALVDSVSFRLFARPGQRDHGIDMYGRRPDGTYVGWQAKRRRSFSPRALRTAIDEALGRNAPFPLSRLVVVGTFDDRDRALLEALESSRDEHPDLEIDLVGSTQLTRVLRSAPEIVSRHLGEEWRNHLCGEPEGEALDAAPLATGGICRVRDADWRDLGVAPAVAAAADHAGVLPYLYRGMPEDRLSRAVDICLATPGTTVLVIDGPPEAGKKRLAHQVLLDRCPNAWIIAPATPSALDRVYRPESHAEIAGDPGGAVVLWLQNVEMYAAVLERKAREPNSHIGTLRSYLRTLQQADLGRSVLVVCTAGGKGRQQVEAVAVQRDGTLADDVRAVLDRAAHRFNLPYELEDPAEADDFGPAAREEIERIGVGPFAVMRERLREFYIAERWPTTTLVSVAERREGLALADALAAWRLAVSDEPVDEATARAIWQAFRPRRDVHGRATDEAWKTAGVTVSEPVVRYSPLAAWTADEALDLNDAVLAIADHVALITHLYSHCRDVVLRSGVDQFVLARRIEGLTPEPAERLYRDLADAGDPRGMVNLGARLLSRAPQEARELWARAAAMGEPMALANLGLLAFSDGDQRGGEERLRRAAEAGVPIAMFNLAMELEDVDPLESDAWLEQAMAEDEPNAWFTVALRTEPTDPETAREMYYRAAQYGSVDARLRLADLTVDEDPDEAEFHLRLAAGSMEPLGYHGLAFLVAERDPSEAEFLLRRAVVLGHDESVTPLLDLIVTRDDTDAHEYARRADDAGSAAAAAWLAAQLEDDDPEEALVLYRRGADRGSASAMFRLGELAEPDDPADAAQWYDRAAALDHAGATRKLAIRALKEKSDDPLTLLERAARLGDTFAYNVLTLLMFDRDRERGYAMLMQVAESGDDHATRQLAALFKQRYGDQAESLLASAAESAPTAHKGDVPVPPRAS